MHLGKDFFCEFILIEVWWASWICTLIFFPQVWEVFDHYLFEKISCPFLSFWDSCNYVSRLSVLPCLWGSANFYSNFSPLFFKLQKFYWSISHSPILYSDISNLLLTIITYNFWNFIWFFSFLFLYWCHCGVTVITFSSNS